MCLRKPRLHGGSVSRKGLLQIWTQRRKGASQRIVYNFHSAENQTWNLASAFLMLERVPASKPATTHHVMVYRCIIVEIILYIALKCYDHHLAAVYERERRMCLRKPQLHGGSMSWEGLLQIWPQRRKGASILKIIFKLFSVRWKPKLKTFQCFSDVGAGPCIKTNTITSCDGKMHFNGNHVTYCHKAHWPLSWS